MKRLIITLLTLLLLSATVFAGVEQNLNDRIEQIEDRIEELQDELKKYGNKKFKITENDRMKVETSMYRGGRATFSFLKMEFNLKTIKPIFTYIGGKTLKYYKKALKAFKDHSAYSMNRYRKLFKNVKYATFYFNLYLKKEENRKKLEKYLNNRPISIKEKIKELSALKNKLKKLKEKHKKKKKQKYNKLAKERKPIFLGLQLDGTIEFAHHVSTEAQAGLRFEYLSLEIERGYNYGVAFGLSYSSIADNNKSYEPGAFSQKYLNIDLIFTLMISSSNLKHNLSFGLGPGFYIRLSNNSYTDKYDYHGFAYGVNFEIFYKYINPALKSTLFVGLTVKYISKRNDFFEDSSGTFFGIKLGFLFNIS